MKKNFEDLRKFNQVANYYLGHEDWQDTKLNYRLGRVLERLNKYFKKFNEELEDLNIEFQATDENEILLFQENGARKYTKDGEKKRLQAIRELTAEWEKKEFEFEPSYLLDVPKLPETHLELLQGFIFQSKINILEQV